MGLPQKKMPRNRDGDQEGNREPRNKDGGQDGQRFPNDMERNYVVEFPMEEEDGPKSPKSKLHEWEEKALTVAMNKALVLKRPREVTLNKGNMEVKQKEEERARKIRKGKQLMITAKEEGLTTPAPNLSMSIISWNCQGLAAPTTIRELTELCKTH